MNTLTEEPDWCAALWRPRPHDAKPVHSEAAADSDTTRSPLVPSRGAALTWSGSVVQQQRTQQAKLLTPMMHRHAANPPFPVIPTSTWTMEQQLQAVRAQLGLGGPLTPRIPAAASVPSPRMTSVDVPLLLSTSKQSTCTTPPLAAATAVLTTPSSTILQTSSLVIIPAQLAVGERTATAPSTSEPGGSSVAAAAATSAAAPSRGTTAPAPAAEQTGTVARVSSRRVGASRSLSSTTTTTASRRSSRVPKARLCHECRMAQKAGQSLHPEHVCTPAEPKTRKRTHWVLLSTLPAALHSSVRTVDQLSKFERDFYRQLEVFYSGKEDYVENVILPLVTRPRVDKRLSARLINWLASCYTLCDAASGEKVDIVYEVTWDGQLLETEEERVAWQSTQPEERRNSSWSFNLEASYKKVLQRDTKDFFDPFRRGPWLAVKLRNRDDYFLTTLGQLNFMAWAIRWKVLEYALRHRDAINTHMRSLQPMRPRQADKRRRLISEPVPRRHSAGQPQLYDESEDEEEEDDDGPQSADMVPPLTAKSTHEDAHCTDKVVLASQAGPLQVPASMTRLAAGTVGDRALGVRAMSAAAIRRRRRPSTYHTTRGSNHNDNVVSVPPSVTDAHAAAALPQCSEAVQEAAGPETVVSANDGSAVAVVGHGSASARSSRKRKQPRPTTLSGSEKFWMVQTAPTGAIVPVVTTTAPPPPPPPPPAVSTPPSAASTSTPTPQAPIPVTTNDAASVLALHEVEMSII